MWCDKKHVIGLSTYILIVLVYIELAFCSSLDSFLHGVSVFGDRLSKEILKSPGNAVFSPYSVHAALSLLALGAKEDTLTKLLSGLSVSNLNTLKNNYKELTADTNNTDIHIANTVVINNKFKVLKTYLKDTKNTFDALAQNLAFDGTAEKVVNKWISEKTHGYIEEMIPAGTLRNNLPVLLINAIHFKGDWEIKFNRSKTVKNYIFHGYNKNVKCEMMMGGNNEKTKYMYLEKDNIQALEMNFKEDNIKIAFVRPVSETEDLKKAQEMFTGETFFKELKHFKAQKVLVKIPKLRISAKYKLRHSLVDIGFGVIFERPNLENMLPNSTTVSNVLHNAVFEINEDGVKAAAVTVTHLKTATRDPPTFELNRPFLFYIYDKEKKIIYFSGKIEDPTASD